MTQTNLQKLTRKEAINQFCKDCIYDPSWKDGGGVLQQIEACTSKSCALYFFRPTSRAKSAEKSTVLRS